MGVISHKDGVHPRLALKGVVRQNNCFLSSLWLENLPRLNVLQASLNPLLGLFKPTSAAFQKQRFAVRMLEALDHEHMLHLHLLYFIFFPK